MENRIMEIKIKELEKLGKPIIHCSKYKVNKIENRFFSIVYFTNKTNFQQSYACYNIEETENTLITDDFIFIKEI